MKTQKARLALVAAFALLFATEVAGQSVAPVNRKFLEWQKRRTAEPSVVTNAQRRSSSKGGTVLRENGDNEEAGFGLVPTVMDMDYLADINAGIVRAPVGGFPSSYDLRALNRLTPIRNQNPYGTCWAFAAMGSLESGILGNEGVSEDFSENNLANLHGWDWGFNDGGNALMAMAYFLRWGGPVAESADPYPAPGQSQTLAPVRHVQKVVWVPGKSDSLDNDAIKEAVMERGALYVSYYHASSYYKSATTSYFYPGSHSSNHAVAIVGWDDDYPASNFATRPSGNGAYLVRNSWGAFWGNSGYYWVSYYDGVFARSTMYSFCNAEDSDNYGKIYQYDPLGPINSFSTRWGANIFTATGADRIAAVGFYALAPKTSYSIAVYTSCQSGKPTSGTCALTQTGTTSEPGYVTIPLAQAVSVASGSRFSIVLNLTTPGYSYPHAIEYANTGVTSSAGAAPGQSFYSSNGQSWTDLTQWNGTANFCIKAYAATTVVTPDLASVSVSGPVTVESGQMAAFACTATYTDGSEKTVSANWSLVAGSSYASISSGGTLTAAETAVDRTVVIRASYAEDGIAKTADWQLTVTAGPPSAPTGLSATQGTEPRAVRLNWAAVSGADAYAVYRSATASSANAAYLGVAEATKYSDTSAVPGKDYRYFVKARNSSGTGPFSEGAFGWRALSAPADVAASDGASLDGVAVSWSASEGAARYRVSRADSIEGDFAPVSGWIDATEFFDDTAVAGVKYWYSVIAATDASGSRPSERGVPDDGFSAIPILPESLAVEGAASIASGATSAYSAFAVYSNGSRGVSPVSPTWHVSKGSVARNGTVTAPVVSTNEEVMLTASTTLEGIAVSGSKVILVTTVAPSAPTGVVATASSPSQGVSVTWHAVPGASGYRVHRSVGAPPVQSCVGMVTDTSFADTTATPGIAYEYRVSAVNSAGESALSAPAIATVPIAAPMDVTATKDRDDCVRVSWNAVAGASHYRVARAASADGEKTTLGTWTTAQSFNDVPPASDVTYYFFVQAAMTDSGANVGPWSEPAEGRMKPLRTLVSLSITGPDQVPSSGEAVYSCTANYSDGTSEPVRPAWSATGSAAIERDGRLTALAVTSDATATVAAYFQGMRTTKSVTIVAPKAATATVTSVFAAQRWPYSGLVDIDYTIEASPSDTLATISVSATDHDHGRALAATTLTGDGASAPVSAGSHRITWNLAADHPGFHAAAMDVSIEAVPAKRVIVSFDGNGGTPSAVSMSGIAGDAYGTLPTATRTGYDFIGWFTAATGGTQVTASSLVDESVTTLYAHWTAKTYTVTLNQQNGSGGTASVTATYGAAMPAITVPSRTGYTFGGYYTSTGGSGTQYYTASGVSARAWDKTSARTLYAKWTAKTYTVTLNQQNGSGGTASVTATYGAAMPAITVPTKSGYTFGGYWTSANGTGTMYYDGFGASARAWDKTATTTLFAKWIPGGNLPTGGDLHVDAATGNDDNDGRSWATAKASIQNAINVSSTGNLILVNDGRYEPVSTSNKRIEIRSVNGAEVTIIDASLQWSRGVTNRCATLGSDSSQTDTVLSGFCLTNGVASYGGGSYSGTLSNCTVSGNSASDGGGGTCEGVLSNCRLIGNVSGNIGGGGSWSQLNNCILRGNTARVGGGFYFGGLNNCVLSGNSAAYGGGAADSTLNNCIVWGNTAPTSNAVYRSTCRFSCLDQAVTGNGNIVADPLFVDAANGDFRLRTGSPCIDAGSNVYVAGDTDLAGNPRIVDGTVDMGAYEGGITACIVTFDGNGGTPSRASMFGVVGETYGTLPTATRSGYRFAGWSTRADGGILVNADSIVPNSATTLYANWKSVSEPIWTIVNGVLTDVDLNGATDIEIPSTVTAIGTNVFFGCSSLESVVVPSSVKDIRSHAFERCSGLWKIVFSEGMQTLGFYALGYCSSLKRLDIPASVYGIDDFSTVSCHALEWIEVSLGNAAYMSDVGILFNKSKTRIERFPEAYAVTDYAVPVGVTLIGDGAFSQCTRLTSVTIPSGVTYIGGWAFSGCSSLAHLDMPSSVTTISTAALRSTALKRFAWPSSVKVIANDMFVGCQQLEEISIPYGVTSIGSWAFQGCKNLTKVVIPSTVSQIGSWSTFEGCQSLRNVTIMGDLDNYSGFSNFYANTPSDLVTYVTSKWTGPTGTWNDRAVRTMSEPIWTIENGVLTAVDLNGATDIEIPSTVKSIGDYALRSKGMTSLIIPDSVTNIGYFAVAYCNKLSSVAIPPTCTNVGRYAFHACQGLVSVSIPEGVSNLREYAFYSCRELDSVCIPSSVTNLEHGVFADCSKLKAISVDDHNTKYCSINGMLMSKDKTTLVTCPASYASAEIPYGVTCLDFHAFSGCTNLTSIAIPPTVRIMKQSVFRNCTGLTSITIPSSVTEIWANVFYGCRGLTSVEIPASVRSLDSSAFSSCDNLVSINVNPSNPSYCSVDGIVFSKDMTRLNICPAGKYSATIPDGIQVIAASAFDGCKKLRSIIIPSTVKTIGSYAFSSCSGLTSVTIRNGVERIYNDAFRSCSGIAEMVIPESVKDIGDCAFEYCSTLRSLTIQGALDSYTGSGTYLNAPVDNVLAGTPADLVVYVTSNWTGPTDKWFNRTVQQR